MTTTYRFIEAIDTWSFRGNRQFGDAGSYGLSDFPPSPSVVAGAFRSLLLNEAAEEIGTFAQGGNLSDPQLAQALGTLDKPGSFGITSVLPARLGVDGDIEAFLPLPADVVVSEGGQCIQRLQPQPRQAELICSGPGNLPCLPVLRQSRATKPESGWLLTSEGMVAYMEGRTLSSRQLLHSTHLWSDESRVGIGMEAQSRTAEDGKLFSLQHTAPRHGENDKASESGLLVGVHGCGKQLPARGLLRLGGDGRAAAFRQAGTPAIGMPAEQIARSDRFKLVLQTPGLFANGWLPDGIHNEGGSLMLELEGLRAQLLCATVPRYEVISGWDLARWQPKPAERVAPAGSVYWFELRQSRPEQLGKLAEQGLWGLADDNHLNRQRQAEGYNRILIAAW